MKKKLYTSPLLELQGIVEKNLPLCVSGTPEGFDESDYGHQWNTDDNC